METETRSSSIKSYRTKFGEGCGPLRLNNSRLVSICVTAALATLTMVGCSPNAPSSQSTHPSTSLPIPPKPSAYQQGMDLYEKGSFREAFELWKPLAEQGNADAQVNLGGMYVNGQGVTEDDVQAVAWFRKAADQGDADAQYSLGVSYAKGQGVDQDYIQAVEWYGKAANRGNSDAQYSMGASYERGQGVAKDEAQAVGWYRKAADQGDARAKHSLENSDDSMTFAAGGVAPFARRFTFMGPPAPLDGAFPLTSNCDVVFLLVAMVQKGDRGFSALADSAPLAQREEACALKVYLSKHNVDGRNTFKREAAREPSMSDAQQVIDKMKSARAFYCFKRCLVKLKHYQEDSQGFELVMWDFNLEAAEDRPMSAFEQMQDELQNGLNHPPRPSPVDVEAIGQTLIKPANHSDAIKIEDMVAETEEQQLYGIVFFWPVSFGGKFSEGRDSYVYPDSMHIHLKITGAIIYDVFNQKPRLRLSTDSF